MQENKPSIFRIFVTFVTIYSFLLFAFPAKATLPPLSNAQVYTLASRGDVYALRAAIQRGLNIDSLDRNGNTALCHSIIQRNYTAYNALRAAGANPNHPCMQRIIAQNRESFLSSKRVVPTTANSRQAYSYVGDEEFVFSTESWITLGAILAGATIAVIFGLGGGGGGDDPQQYYQTTDYNLAEIVGTKIPDTLESTPYSPIFLLAQNGNVIVNGYYPDYNLGGTNQNGWVISNDSSVNVDDGSGGLVATPLTDLIDFNSSALKYSEYIQTAMKAMNGSTVNNGYASDDPLYVNNKTYLITLKNNTTALAALDSSTANNYSQINIDAENGTMAMIGSVNSTVTNQLPGQINMLFRGSAENHSIVGMYADTSSTALNQGTIYGQAISSNSSNGTLVGMRGQLINQENPISSKTYVKNIGTVTIDGSALNTSMSTSLIGMGSWLEDSFLDGTSYLSRAGNIYLDNQGSVVLNMLLSGDSGAYGLTSEQLLQGSGGIIGIKADGNTTATNSGLVQINVEDDGGNTVNGSHAGMLSVHGGNIINNNTIQVNGGTGGYGMLSVRGEGTNSEFNNVSPSLINSGKILVDSENGFGMASMNGNALVNSGTISLAQVGTGMLLQNGTITNSGDIALNEGGIAVSLTGKGTVNNNSSASIVIDAVGTDSSESSGSEDGSATEDTETTSAPNNIGISAQNGAVNNEGNITITNSGNFSDVTAYAIKTSSANVQNTAALSLTDINTAYGVSVNNGGINNNGQVTIGSSSGVVYDSAYGLVSQTGNIQNTAQISIDSMDSAYAISSASRNVVNNAVLNINQNSNAQTSLAYGIQASSGSIQNTANINIKNANENYGLSSTNGNLTNSGAIKISNPESTLSETAYALQVLGKGDIANAGTALIFIDGSNNAYGISSVSGNITNNANININQNTNVQTELAYGIQAQSGAIQNTADITINNVNQGYGLSSTNGNVTNSGTITFSSPSTALSDTTYGIQVTGKGDIVNNENATISINNSNQAYALSAANGNITSNAAISINGSTGASSALAYGIQGGIGNVTSNNAITINNANEGYGISVQNGEVTNNAVISLSNSQQTQNKTSYGIYATTGSVINNADIIMDVTGDLSGGIDTDTGSFGIWAEQANILNNQDATITFKKRGNGMYSSSGSVDNYGSISLEAGGMAMSSASGDIINHENASISITDTGIGLQSTTGKVINDGSLEIAGDVSTGLSSGNAATNNNSIIINGDNGTGMIATADNAALTNNSSIEIYTDENSVYNYAMRGADGKFTNLTNSATGTILIEAQNQLAPSENYAYAMYFDSGEAFNHGTITANNIYTYGMYFANGGTIVNANSIELNYGGVGLYGNSSATSETETASLTNKTGATITINGDTSYGMQALGVTTAFNEGTIEITGSSSYGLSTETGSGTNIGSITMNSSESIGMFSGAADLINDTNGTITINGTNSFGMQANSSGSTDTSKRGVVNNGTITLAEGSDESVGIQINGEGKGFNNKIITVKSDESSGVLAAGDSTITNNVDGEIKVSGSGAYGMFAEGSGTVINSGTITVTATDAYALYATSGGTINNNKGAVIETSGSSALYVDGATANNYADIKNNNTGFNAIYATGDSTVDNTATITLEGEGSSAIYIASGSNTEATNSGTLNITANNSNGAFVGGGTFTNAAGGQINVGAATASVDKSYGINAESAEINNNSSINVYSSSGAGINSISGSINNNSGASVVVSGSDAIGINTNSGEVINAGTLNVSGTSTVGIQSASGAVVNQLTGNISVNGNGGDAVGIYTETGNITNAGNVYVESNTTSDKVVGLQTGSASISNSGYVYAEGTNAIGIYATSGGSVENTKNVQVEGSGAIGIKVSGSGGEITNGQNGTIAVVGNNAVGVAADGDVTAENSGTIIVSGTNAIGMSASNGATATNSGTIYVSGSGAIGMYATGGSNLVNSAGASIYLLGGASLAMQVDDEVSTIVNEGTIYYSGTLGGTNGLEGPKTENITDEGFNKPDSTTQLPSTDLAPVTVVAAQNSRLITSSSRMFSLAYDTNDIMESNQMEYRANGVLATSDENYAGALAPVLFAASYEENNDEEIRDVYEQEIKNAQQVENSLNSQDGTVVVADADAGLSSTLNHADASSSTGTDADNYKIYDLVLAKRATSEAVGNVNGVQDTSLYAKIDEAYENGKDGQFFNSLKTSMTSEELVSDIKDEFGLGLFNNFAKQNLDVIRSANRQLNAAVFNNQEDKDIRTMVGFDLSAREQDGDAYSDDYEDEAQSVYAMADMKANESFRYGLGALLTKYSSKYNDDSASRDEIMVQVLAPLTYSPNKSFKIVSIPRIGMGFGDYTRRVDSGTYDGDTKNYYYGITNEARQVIDLGWMAFEPTLEFNVLGMHQDKIDESGALEVEASDSISVEGGVGFYATKLFEFGEAHKLKFRAGGTFYHEFGNPFKAQKARMRDADIYYRLNGYDAGRNRGIVSVRMDYDYNSNFNIYGEFNKFIEDNDAYSVNAGMGYRF